MTRCEFVQYSNGIKIDIILLLVNFSHDLRSGMTRYDFEGARW